MGVIFITKGLSTVIKAQILSGAHRLMVEDQRGHSVVQDHQETQSKVLDRLTMVVVIFVTRSIILA